mmetsp:Transcript_29402/g.90112  ORF Transcript_29402/g.90112 Transcript_29402/m.90112 type:complete len:264 (+) Transcript_29402:356-1147(+)
MHPTYRLVVTGHSAGGALASIFIAELATFRGVISNRGSQSGPTSNASRTEGSVSPLDLWSRSEIAPLLQRPLAPPPLYITFAAPMAGNHDFAGAIDAGLAAQDNVLLRVVNARDPAVRSPNALVAGGRLHIPCLMGGQDQFSHPGQEIWLPEANNADMRKALFCNSSGSFGDADDATESDPNPMCSSSLAWPTLTWTHHNSYLAINTNACPDTFDASSWEGYATRLQSLRTTDVSNAGLSATGADPDRQDDAYIKRIRTYSYE